MKQTMKAEHNGTTFTLKTSAKGASMIYETTAAGTIIEVDEEQRVTITDGAGESFFDSAGQAEEYLDQLIASGNGEWWVQDAKDALMILWA